FSSFLTPFFSSYASYRDLHSFPTRRSSDLAIVLFCAAFAPLLTTYEVDGQDVLDRRLPPIWTKWTEPDSAATPEHILGTDNLGRSEEHTSELQSLRHLVCRLLLEKKKKKQN